MSEDAFVRIESHGRVRLVTLNRPDRRNALGTRLMTELEAAVRISPDDRFGAVVIAGSGPAFCAGSDLKELAGLTPSEMAEHERATATIAASFADADIPVIAAVEGYALGGGMILAASCDLVVTAENVRWSMPEVKNGWLPPWGLGALVARVGPQRALALTWGASACDGAEAYRIGLADHVTPDGDALAYAVALAANLAELPGHAIQSTKQFYSRYRQSAALDPECIKQFETDAAHPAAQDVLSRFMKKL